MSGIGSSLPPVDLAALPADVRAGSAQDRREYTGALAFERALLEELLRQVDLTGSEASGGDGAPAAYRDMVPSALAESLSGRGGLGLARTLYEAGRLERS